MRDNDAIPAQPDADNLTPEGKLNGIEFKAHLKKLNPNQFRLMKKGFRWIDDGPWAWLHRCGSITRLCGDIRPHWGRGLRPDL